MQFAIQQQIQPKDRVAVAILDPRDGKTPTGITIHLAGRYTKAFKAAQALVAQQMAGDATDAEALERLRDLVAACTTGWEGVKDEAGADVLPTPDAVRALYTQVEWVYEQVRGAYLDTSRFFESATAS
jgi:hypothetical protein